MTPRERRWCNLLGFGVPAGWVVHAVLSSTRSTAAIGLALVPVLGAIGVVVARLGYGGLQRGGRARWLVLGLTAALAVGTWCWRHDQAQARAADTPPARLLALFGAWRPWPATALHEALAANPATPPALWPRLMATGQPGVLAGLAGRADMPEAQLLQLAAWTSGVHVHARLAAHPGLTPVLAERLLAQARSGTPATAEQQVYQTFVLAALARNPRLPMPLFQQLATWPQPEYFLVLALVESGRASCAQLAGWAEGPHPRLHGNVTAQARRQGCP